ETPWRMDYSCSFLLCSISSRLGKFDLHSQRESHFAEDLFYLIERLATEILGLEHLLLGPLNKLADMADIRIFKTVCRPNREFQFVNAAEEVLVEGGFGPDLFLLGLGF